jgi:hypothetical protein
MNSDRKGEDFYPEDVDTLISTLHGLGVQLGGPAAPLGFNSDSAMGTGSRTTHTAGFTSNFSLETRAAELEVGDPPLPVCLTESNVAEALRKADSLHMQRYGQPSVLSPYFASPLFEVDAGRPVTSGENVGRLAPFDFHPSLGHSGHGASSVIPTPRELPARFLPGAESLSVLQLSKRPKPRAKDVAHRQSLASTGPPRFHDMDISFGEASPGLSAPRYHSPPIALPTEAVHSPERGLPLSQPTTGGRASSSLFLSRAERDMTEGRLGLAWQSSLPDTSTAQATPAPLSFGGGGAKTSPGPHPDLIDSIPFSVTLVLPDGRRLLHPTWPTVNIQVLRRQVSLTFQCVPTALFFVGHGSVLDLERKLSDPPVITGTTPVYVFFNLPDALRFLALQPSGETPPPPPPPALLPRTTFDPLRSSDRTSYDKLRATFKCPKFLGDPRHWKQWNKGFVRFMALQQLDHVLDVCFKVVVMTVNHQQDNKLVYYLLEDAVSGSTVATKYVRRAPEWDGHAAYNSLYDGYAFSGPATATLLLSELTNFRFQVDETASELVLRLQEIFEDLEAVPGQSAVVFSDTQKINYLLSTIKHERSLQPVYVQIQTEQIRGRVTFEQACDDLRYRCEANRADELINERVKGKIRGLIAAGDGGVDANTSPAASLTTPVALITTAPQRQNKSSSNKAATKRAKKDSCVCLAKGCAIAVPSQCRLCRLHYHECIAGKQPTLALRTGGVAQYDASTSKIVYPPTATHDTPTKVKAHVAFASSATTAVE